MDRRQFIQSAAAGFGLLATDRSNAVSAAMVGDVIPGRAIIWSRAGKPARMHVTWKTSEKSANVHKVPGPHCIEATDYTGRLDLTGLPGGQQILYEVQFEDLSSPGKLSQPLKGHFQTPGTSQGEIKFVWSGDVAGQGYGINREWGGMRGFEAMRRVQPDFFIHCGDTIYADSPIPAEIKTNDGFVWKNLVAEEKSKVAESLDEFRGAHRYNLLDENVRRFSSEVSQIWQWDDHEVTNNWSPGKDLASDPRYKEKNIKLLVARATRAFLDYAPIRLSAEETERVYRKISYGPLLDVFVIDMRSYRGPNGFNRQETETSETAFLGTAQCEWLKEGLRSSKATWKAIASDMPIGLIVGDGKDTAGRARFENSSNGDGPALGRELEIAGLLQSIKRNAVRNVVWFTADTHYTAAHHYHPERARFKDFSPFWEFMSGPLNAGTFGPSATDNTFGIEVVYQKTPEPGASNLPPSAGLQFFGEAKIDKTGETMTIVLRNIAGTALYTKVLQTEPRP